MAAPHGRSILSTRTRRLVKVANALIGVVNGRTGSYRPTSIPPPALAGGGFAEAASVQRTIRIKAMLVLLNPKWLPSEARQHAPQPLLELDLRLPAQKLPGPRDVGLANLGIIDW